MSCEVRDWDENVCGERAVAVWLWPGGPRLNMCSAHDLEMRTEVRDCRDCRDRLTREVPA